MIYCEAMWTVILFLSVWELKFRSYSLYKFNVSVYSPHPRTVNKANFCYVLDSSKLLFPVLSYGTSVSPTNGKINLLYPDCLSIYVLFDFVV